MRLIDADELKKAIDEVHQKDLKANPLWGSIGLNTLNRLIDNAPTVSLPDFKEGYKQAILDGKTNFSRPTGEWIDTGDMQEYWAEEYQCSICGGKDHWHNYCPNCGAKMKGGDEE